MPQIIHCPDGAELKQFLLGNSTADVCDTLAEHIETCSACLVRLRTLSANDPLVDAVRAQENLPADTEQDSVRRLIARARAMLPAAKNGSGRAQQDSPTIPPALGDTDSAAAKKPSALEAATIPPALNDTAAGAEQPRHDTSLTDFLAPPQGPGELGRLGKYRILKILGHGGMGVVYMAEDLKLKRTVALKAMLPTLAANDSAGKRFLREAEAMAAVEHDHIVRIYQIDEDRGVPYLAMEFLKGEPLDSRLAKETMLPIGEALRIGREVADGLAAAHDTGLIHRDIKPQNIWLEGASCRVKILDFGLARSAAEDVSLTQTGTIMGTPAFMPPEQAQGEKVDGRCDLYSLGCVLYRMTTGELPIKGQDTISLLMALALNEPTPPDQIRDGVPRALSELIMKLLAKDRNQRPQSAREVSRALKEVEASLGGKAAETAPSSAPPRRALGKDAGAGEAGKQTAVPSEKTRPHRASARPTPAPAAGKSSRGLVFSTVLGAAALISAVAAGIILFIPTAHGVICIDTDDPSIQVKVDDKGNYSIIGADNGKDVSFSVGNHVLLFKHRDAQFATDKFELKKNDKVVITVRYLQGKLKVENNGVIISNKDIPRPKAVADARPGTPVGFKKATWEPGPENALPGLAPRPAILKNVGRWNVISTQVDQVVSSPDGQWLASGGSDYTRVFNARSGALAALLPSDNASGIEWSPDSKWLRIRLLTWQGSAAVHHLMFHALDGTVSPASIDTLRSPLFGWNPKYPLFAYDGGQVIRLVDPNLAKPIEVALDGTSHFQWSPDGERFAARGGDGKGILCARDGKVLAKLDGIEPELMSWSPNAKSFAARTSDQSMRIWKSDGSDAANVKSDKKILAYFWQPDGTAVATFEEDKKLRVHRADGSVLRTIEPGFDVAGFVFGLDGKGVLAWGKDGGKYFPADDTLIQSFSGGNVSTSPDGEAFFTFTNNEAALYRFTQLGFKYTGYRAQGIDKIDWTDKGKSLTLQERGTGKRWSVDCADPKKVTPLAPMESGPVPAIRQGIRQFAFSPKGDKLAVSLKNGVITICDPHGQPTGAPSMRFDETQPQVVSLSWDPEGRLLVAAFDVGGGNLKHVVFDATDGKRLATLDRGVDSKALFAPNDADNLLILGINETALWRWKVEREPLTKGEGLIGQAFWSPDGKHLIGEVAKDVRGTTAVLVSADLKTRVPLGGYFAGNMAACWLPDGKTFLFRTGPESLEIRSLDGKVVEEIRPVPGLDANGISSMSLSPDGKMVLLNMGTNGIYDIAERKVSPLGIAGRGFVFSPDGTHVVNVDGQALRCWNVQTKALERIVLPLPGQQYAIFSPAGEVLARSANAGQHYRYVVEDKNGRLTLKTPVEFEK